MMIGKSFVAVAANPELAREAVASETQQDNRWKPTGKLVDAFEGIPNDLTFFAVADDRGSHVPQWIAGLPILFLVGMDQLRGPQVQGNSTLQDLRSRSKSVVIGQLHARLSCH
jgi:hypothetical protein